MCVQCTVAASKKLTFRSIPQSFCGENVSVFILFRNTLARASIVFSLARLFSIRIDDFNSFQPLFGSRRLGTQSERLRTRWGTLAGCPRRPQLRGHRVYPRRYLLGGSGCCNLWSACQAEVDGLLSGSKGTGWLLRIVNLMRLQVGGRSSLGDELLCQWQV